MANRKVIILDEEMDKILGSVCDAALKGMGLQIIGSINAVMEAVIEESDCSIPVKEVIARPSLAS